MNFINTLILLKTLIFQFRSNLIQQFIIILNSAKKGLKFKYLDNNFILFLCSLLRKFR